jgi:hypothetical protein
LQSCSSGTRRSEGTLPAQASSAAHSTQLALLREAWLLPVLLLLMLLMLLMLLIPQKLQTLLTVLMLL